MKPSSPNLPPFLLILILLFIRQAFSLEVVTVEDVCHRVVGKDPSVNYDFCVYSLRRHPHSDSTDTQGHGVIAASLNLADACYTESKIKDELKIPLDTAIRSMLNKCLSLYKDMIPTLAKAVDAINDRRYDEARDNLYLAMREAKDCDGTFSKAGKISPFAKEDRNSVALSNVAIAITKLLG